MTITKQHGFAIEWDDRIQRALQTRHAPMDEACMLLIHVLEVRYTRCMLEIHTLPGELHTRDVLKVDGVAVFEVECQAKWDDMTMRYIATPRWLVDPSTLMRKTDAEDE